MTGLMVEQKEDHLSKVDFERVCELIRDTCGIKMHPEKKTMVEVRLRRRLRALQIETYAQYCKHIFSPQCGDEVVFLIDAITTNKTDFFREPGHFDVLVQRVLPQLEQRSKPVVVWSAACSSGEEPYTLAMVLSEYAAARPGFNFRIFATDICTDVLERALTAIYTQQVIEPVPMVLRRKYLLRGKNRSEDQVRVAKELRSVVDFQRLNFMDDDYGLEEPVQVIFCRNALIYFDLRTQERIVSKLLRYLEPGGYLFVGHSENLTQMDLPITSVASTVYRKTQ